MSLRTRFGRLVAGALLALCAAGTPAAPVDSGHGRAQLLSALDAAVPGQSVDVALRLDLDPGWHTYWENPGDSGLPVRLDWMLPAGVQAGPIEWPVPERIPMPPYMSYGYHDRVLLPLRVTLPADAAVGRAMVLEATASYLVCREVCLPETAALALTITVAHGPAQADAAGARAIAEARAQLPAAVPGLALTAARSAQGYVLGWSGPRAREAYFFPASAAVLDHAGAQRLENTADGQRLHLPRSAYAAQPAARLSGVLWFKPGAGVPAVVVDVAVSGEVSELIAAPAVSPAGSDPPALLALLGFALLGGLLLNLMPCVFPVLALKVLGLAGAAGGRARAVGFAYLAGVLLSVWVLAGVLLVLKALGQAVGWGFQLQNGVFLAALALLMTAVGVNLLGGFEVGIGVAGRAGTLDRRSGIGGALLSGMLAVLLATPCTAPFMAGALGFALVRPAGVALAVFTALGLGLALPFWVLAQWPALAARLPHPGGWMVRLKQALALPMFATALWLAWVYGRQRGLDGAMLLLAALLVGSFGLCAVGLMQRRRGAMAYLAAVLCLAAAGVLTHGALRAAPRTGDAPRAATRSESGIAWQAWSPETEAGLRAAGRPVFVDFTADWCLSCKVNEALALGDARVVRRFAALDVAALKADWTRYDPAITAALAALGRSGVPVYVYYPPRAAGKLLPSLLTPGMVLAALGSGATPAAPEHSPAADR